MKNCNKCTEPFSKIVNIPINLPCGFSICSECVTVDVNNNFKCFHCMNPHQVPANGFPPAQTIQRLLELKAKDVHRGKFIENFKIELRNLSENINEIEDTLNHGITKIQEHAS